MNVTDLFRLDGRVACVTGASSGIGKAIALALTESGARVVLMARRTAELDETRREIESAGGRAACLACDLADRAALAQCAHASPAPFGTPDGRNGELDDLRGAAVFLASRASDYVTGQTLFIDGGFSAG